MKIFERLRGYRMRRELELKKGAAAVVTNVAGPAASAWWVPVEDGRPVLVAVITEQPSHCRELASALHFEWQRLRPCSRDLDFIVLTQDNARAVALVVSAATPLITPLAAPTVRSIAPLQRIPPEAVASRNI